jgi:hypothetical protein
MRNFYILCLATIIVLFSACCISKARGKELQPALSTTISLNPSPANAVKVMYTGCGGLVVSAGTDAFITDPYYTGHGFWRTQFLKIKIDTHNTENIVRRIRDSMIDPSLIKSVLVTHSHFDHLEDLPWLLHKKKLVSGVRIVGSPSASCTLQNFLAGSIFTNADRFMFWQNPTQNVSGQWISVAPTISVMPIESAHAPHFYCIHAMKGETKCHKFLNFTDPESKTCPRRWREGRTYSYLVDILNPTTNDTLRIFIQTSASNPPYGFPPAAELGKKRVDVAFLCVASYAYVDNYPEALLSLLKPKKTVLIHWENFFSNMYKPNPKGVPGTSLRPFMERLRKHTGVKENKDLQPFFVMPKPLTVMKFLY